MTERLKEFIDFAIRHYRHPSQMEDYLRLISARDPLFADRFSQLYGVIPSAWLWIFRTAMAAEILTCKVDFPMAEVAHFTGFTDETLFEKCFVCLLGQTPQVFYTKARALQQVQKAGATAEALTLTDLAGMLVSKVLQKVAPPYAGSVGSDTGALAAMVFN